MDYITLFKEKNITDNTDYPRNDIGTAKLFHDLHSGVIRYVVEAKTWYTYTGKHWRKDDGGLFVMERCKDFVQALIAHAEAVDDGGDESKAFIKYTSGFHSRRRREGLLSDAKSIAPMSLSAFDTNRYLLNCQNGTLDLKTFVLREHNAADNITKLARVKYVPTAKCARWDRFVDEIMCGDAGTIAFLQKALGYALTGDISENCFFILYGNTTRNGKSTLTETVAYILGDYARTAQPQTLARRSADGASASPDLARLKGARFVCTPEPEKGLELNTALVKQLTGGDTYTARNLHENPIEFCPEFKLFINTNHLPRTSDDTVFSSGRVKLIPFERHFSDSEQDKGLKKLFRRGENKSAVLNWLVEGYRLLLEVGLEPPQRVVDAIAAYRAEADVFGTFIAESTVPWEDARLPTSELYAQYTVWARDNGYKQMNNKNFVGELRRRFDVRRTGAIGNVVVGLTLDMPELPY